jgi:hypothetical protein
METPRCLPAPQQSEVKSFRCTGAETVRPMRQWRKRCEGGCRLALAGLAFEVMISADLKGPYRLTSTKGGWLLGYCRRTAVCMAMNLTTFHGCLTKKRLMFCAFSQN